jgi:hypothetical protein
MGVALLALAACTGDEIGRGDSSSVSFSEWDSAGVRIVESSGKALDTALPWVVDTVPDLELGQVERAGPLLFADIRGIMALPDGGLVILDGSSGELRWFDASGEHVRTFGRKGQGPGQFLNPLLVPRFQADSLLVFDRQRRAFSWVAIDGSRERRLRPSGLFAGTPRVSVGSKALFSSASYGIGSCPVNERCEHVHLSRWVEADGTGADDTLTTHTLRMLKYHHQAGRPFVLTTGPFDQKGVAAPGPDGPVVEGSPRFELRQFDAGGRLIAIFRVDAPLSGDPEDALDRYVEAAPEMRPLIEMMGLPEVLPAFQSLRVDRAGWYWAELFRVGKAPTSEWLVFDPQGRARGMVQLPSDIEVHQIELNYILGRWIDEFGVEYVRRYALDRRGG